MRLQLANSKPSIRLGLPQVRRLKPEKLAKVGNICFTDVVLNMVSDFQEAALLHKSVGAAPKLATIDGAQRATQSS